MKVHEMFPATVVLMLLLLANAASAAQQPAAPAAAPPAQQQQQQEPAAAPSGVAQQPLTPSSIPLRVMVGKSLLVNTTERLRRVSVTDPAVADALVVTPNQILVHGRAPGEVSLVLWDEQERSRSFDLRVDVDITAASEEIKHIFPDEQINLSASRSAIVLAGHVSRKDVAEHAGLVAGAFSKNVVNVLTFGPVGAQEILLEVKFAEVNREAITQLGVNLFSTGAANTIGSATTQQFGQFQGSNVGAIPSDITPGTTPAGNNLASGAINGIGNHHAPASFGSSDLLNLFLFRSDINLGAIIKALQSKNVLQILAEPNLIALNGKESSFLAGGEFPIPIVQGGAIQSVTIQFKEFGVRLAFTPEIMPNGNIHLVVKPEVSALDFANGLRLSGFVVPALTTRRAQTEFEMQDGQSFVIAGLLDNRLADQFSKVPGLGDIPILGNIFRSKNVQRNKTELMVLVTARRISPSAQPAALPKMPRDFLKEEKFDTSSKTKGLMQ